MLLFKYRLPESSNTELDVVIGFKSLIIIKLSLNNAITLLFNQNLTGYSHFIFFHIIMYIDIFKPCQSQIIITYSTIVVKNGLLFQDMII